MQELAPEEPKEEDPFNGIEAEEAAESAAEVKEEPEQDLQAGMEDADMVPAQPEQECKDAGMEEVPDEETVHMPATQDDPGVKLCRVR